MDGVTKPKHQVLQEFAAVLFNRNPMQLGQDNPLEYESEALSILSRFTESALHLADDEASIAIVATGIVKQTLEFWFEDITGLEPEPIARELIAVFRVAHGLVEPTPEVTEETRPVTEITIGE